MPEKSMPESHGLGHTSKAELDPRQKDDAINILREQNFFGVLDGDSLSKLAARAEFIVRDAESLLCVQGEKPDRCYVVVSGHVGVFIQGRRHSITHGQKVDLKRIATRWAANAHMMAGHQDAKSLSTDIGGQAATLGPGSLVGEFGLINRQPRNATVKCLSRCELLVIGRVSLRAVIQSEMFLKNLNIKLFQELPPRVLTKVATSTELVAYRAGEYVFWQGEVPDKCYVIFSGEVEIFIDNEVANKRLNNFLRDAQTAERPQRRSSTPSILSFAAGAQSSQSAAPVTNPGDKVAQIGHGTMFGELALMNEEPRAATVKCLTDCTFLAINKGNFESALKEEMKQAADEKGKFLAAHLPGFESLISRQTYSKCKDLAYFFKKATYPRGHVFVSQGNQDLKGEGRIGVIQQGSADFFRAMDTSAHTAAQKACQEFLQGQHPQCSTPMRRAQSGTHLCGFPADDHAGTLSVGGIFVSLPNSSDSSPFTLVASSTPCVVWQVSGADLQQLPKQFTSMVQKAVAEANAWRVQSYSSVWCNRWYQHAMTARNKRPSSASARRILGEATRGRQSHGGSKTNSLPRAQTPPGARSWQLPANKSKNTLQVRNDSKRPSQSASSPNLKSNVR